MRFMPSLLYVRFAMIAMLTLCPAACTYRGPIESPDANAIGETLALHHEALYLSRTDERGLVVDRVSPPTTAEAIPGRPWLTLQRVSIYARTATAAYILHDTRHKQIRTRKADLRRTETDDWIITRLR
jgi:predicted small lipoprotein YifL